MIVLYILGGLVALVAIVLLLPISVSLNYNEKLCYKIKIAFIKIPIGKEKEDVPEKETEKKTDNTEKTNKNFFTKLKEKKGFSGALREIIDLIKDSITPLKQFLRFLKFRDVKLSVAVVGEDAAKTAVDYGLVCSAVYPILSFVEGFSRIKYKNVDISADFEGKKSNIDFSLKIKTNIIFILIFAVKIYNQYKNFCIRNDL